MGMPEPKARQGIQGGSGGGGGVAAESLVRVVVRVDLRVLGPLLRQLVLSEARINRAGLDARVAVDALVGVDIELLDPLVVGLIGGGMDAVARTHLDARVVLRPDARLRDHVGQSWIPFRSIAGSG